MCERAVECGQISVSATDHGSIAAVPELFRTANDYGLKPIAGMEAYLTGDMANKTKESDTWHLTVLARNLDGYRNLCKLVTASYRDGFYGKPRIDLKTLLKHKSGLVVLSGCLNGPIADAIVDGDHKRALELAMLLNAALPNSFFLEYMDHGIKAQKAVNATYDRWTRQNPKLRGVVTQDSHYMFEEDAAAHQTLLCIGSRSSVQRPSFKFDGGPYHYCDGADLSKHFDMQLLRRSRQIADECEFYSIPKTGSMPALSPAALEGCTPNAYLERIAWEGFKKRGIRKGTYVQRLRDELTTVYQLGYSAYFIMVADMLGWARKQGILVGPGRGSSAGSLLAYCLQITDIDPIRYGLYFERFLNRDRVSPPDIDVDIADSGRQQVLQYVREKYGEEKVAHIGSFSALGPRQSIRDVAVAHGMAHEKVNAALKLVDHDPMMKFEDVERMSVVTQSFSKEIIKEAKVMNGKYRHMSTHAAGIIIANHDLNEHLPLVVRNEVTQTMYDMDELAHLGYVKFDILGLKTLGVIDNVMKKARLGKKEWQIMNEFDDQQTYDLICAGHTVGVFQLEGWGITRLVKRYAPRSFEDIMMINALYRPGPMQGGEGLEVILRRRNGEESVTYKHQSLEPILRDTYGLPVFQEQVMRMCQILAGFTLAEADNMRSAIGKKDEAKLASQRSSFINGCMRKGHTRDFAEEIFHDIEFFNRYGWNRAHAAAYGAVTYYTAWLKTHFKEHFMAELLNYEDDPERTMRIRSECHKLNVEFDPVDINKSDVLFTVLEPNKTLLPGFANVKGVGEKAAQAIIDNRYLEGKFHSKQEARDRVARKVLNKTMFENLAKAGAFRDLPEIAEPIKVPF